MPTFGIIGTWEPFVTLLRGWDLPCLTSVAMYTLQPRPKTDATGGLLVAFIHGRCKESMYTLQWLIRVSGENTMRLIVSSTPRGVVNVASWICEMNRVERGGMQCVPNIACIVQRLEVMFWERLRGNLEAESSYGILKVSVVNKSGIKGTLYLYSLDEHPRQHTTRTLNTA